MHQSKYDKAGWISHQEIARQVQWCAPCLRPIIRSFAANIARIESAWLLLPYLVHTTIQSSALSVQVMHTKLGTYDIDDPRQSDPEIAKVLQDEFRRLSMEHAVKHFEEDTMSLALQQLDYVLTNSPLPFIKTGIETALASQVLNAWTAVESLLKDLWETALNHGPKKWVSKAMDSGPMRALKDQERSIPSSIVQRYRYDLTQSMGAILIAKLDFETIDEIIERYVSVFGEDIRKIYPDDVLQNVRALEAIRHLFAHRGGIVDNKFKGKVKNLKQYSDLEIGKQLVIDGEIAGNLTWDAIDLAMGLMKFVDH